MARERLETYRRKRDFEQTPEPSGKDPAFEGEGRFVIQEHHATSLHWDLRLEHDGVLVSWAVPKGLPPTPNQNNLAVHTEDHPLSYYDFEGTIPKGNYGAGEMRIWDQGTYVCHKFSPKKVVVTLDGNRAKGKYALFQTQGKNWLVHRMDEPETTWEAMPQDITPMLAKPAKAFPRRQAEYRYEIKWDGIRALGYVEGGRLRLQSRNLRDITAQYPELKSLGKTLGSTQVVLDGEICALDENGKPSFSRLQNRMNLQSASAIKRRAEDTPVVYMIFDLLYQDGRNLCRLPYLERRERLEKLALRSTHWQTPAAYGDGKSLMEAARQQKLEGIIGKRADSTYEAGKRSAAWFKLKNILSQEFVIGGWYPGEGGREGRIGALLLGYYDHSPKTPVFRFAGKVGTGFTDKMLKELEERLMPLRKETSPFGGTKQPQRGAVFVAPELIAEVEFTEWTHEATLRHPAFKGLRFDKDATEIVRELH